MKIIVYNNKENTVSIVIPCTTELTLVEIGIKSIPKDIPFWIVENADLPITPQETWKLEDMGTPDGYGEI